MTSDPSEESSKRLPWAFILLLGLPLLFLLVVPGPWARLFIPPGPSIDATLESDWASMPDEGYALVALRYTGLTQVQSDKLAADLIAICKRHFPQEAGCMGNHGNRIGDMGLIRLQFPMKAASAPAADALKKDVEALAAQMSVPNAVKCQPRVVTPTSR